MKNKHLTFSAGIIGTCVFSILTLINTLSMIFSFIFLYEYIFFGIMGLFIVIFDVFALVFNSFAIKCKEYEVFAKNKGIIITAVVLNFLLILYGFFSGFTIFYIWALIFSIISIPALICANVFYIVDLARKTQPVKADRSEVNNTKENIFVDLERIANLREKNIISQEEFDKFKTEILKKQNKFTSVNLDNNTQSLTEEEKLYAELEQLSSLKDKGVLNDEEFNNFKAQIIEKLVNTK